jgi:hypothetical protein
MAEWRSVAGLQGLSLQQIAELTPSPLELILHIGQSEKKLQRKGSCIAVGTSGGFHMDRTIA